MRLLLASVIFSFVVSVSQAKHPHIVFVMADDMGYGDPTCYNSNSKIATTAIDRLAREGVRFTDAHAPAAVCVPTRFGLLTGQYPFRMNGGRGPLIPENQPTIATLLRKQGYKTAMVGKWHLGFTSEKNPTTGQQQRGGPIDHGFDSYFGIPASLDIPPYYYIKNDRCVSAPSEKIGDNFSEGVTRIQGAFWRAGGIAPGYEHADVLPTFTTKALQVVDHHMESNSDKPLFLYLALPAPHTPWLPLDESKGKSKAGDYGDFTLQVDKTIERLFAKLEEHKIADETLFIFTSDNGPVWYEADEKRYDHECVGSLRGMKGDAWEGGHRMPFIVRWPGHAKAGTVCEQTISHVDMLATFASITGTEKPSTTDSVNMQPLFEGKTTEQLRKVTIFQSSGKRVQSIRMGNWKMIPQLGSGGFSKPRTEKPVAGGPTGQLYDLSTDMGETKNLWLKHPEQVKLMQAELEKLLATK